MGALLLAAYLALYCGVLDWLPLQRRGFVATELDVVSEWMHSALRAFAFTLPPFALHTAVPRAALFKHCPPATAH